MRPPARVGTAVFPLLILVIGLLFLVRCSKDAPTAPTSGESTTPPGATAVIGAGGGTVGTADFLLTIPAGAFATQETVSVSVDQSVTDFNAAELLAPVIKLAGMPDRFSKPLQVRFKCSRTAGSGILVAVGEQGTALTSGTTAMAYRPVGARDSSGYLLATVSPQALGASKIVRAKTAAPLGMPETVRWFAAMDEHDTLLSPGGAFRVIYPRYLKARVTSLAGYLDEAYGKFPQLGFGNDPYFSTAWPVDVFVSHSDEGADLGSFVIGEAKEPMPSWHLAFKGGLLAQASESLVRRVAGQLFSFAFCLSKDRALWDPVQLRNIGAMANRIWPYWAIAGWAEEEFVAAAELASFAPLHLRGRETRPLEGMPFPSGESLERHGGGMAGLMKYIVTTYGMGKLVALYNKVPAVTHAADALIETLTDGPDVWWPGFMKAYLSGTIYNVPTDSLLKKFTSLSSPDQFTIAGPSDTLKTFSASYPDFSARLYKINLQYKDIKAGRYLRLLLDAPGFNPRYVGLMVFGLKDNALEYWAYSSDVKVEKLQELTAADYDIVVAVVSALNQAPYDGSRTIGFTARVGGSDLPVPDKIATQGYVYAGVVGWFRDSNGALKSRVGGYGAPYVTARDGIVSGNTFTASWNGPWPNSDLVSANGNLSISFDNSSPPHVIAFMLNDTTGTVGYTKTISLGSGSCNITPTLENDWYTYRAVDAEMKSLLGTFYWRETTDIYWYQLPSLESMTSGSIAIYVKKW